MVITMATMVTVMVTERVMESGRESPSRACCALFGIRHPIFPYGRVIKAYRRELEKGGALAESGAHPYLLARPSSKRYKIAQPGETDRLQNTSSAVEGTCQTRLRKDMSI